MPTQALDAVQITASPLNRTELDSLQPATVLRGDALRLRDSTSLGDALGREIGVQSSSYGPGSGRPIIRGMDSARVRITESGLGVADVSGASPDHRVSADTLNSAQVEILRGPATLLYGSGAIGGLVNIVSDRVPRLRPNEFGAELNLKLASAERERTAAAGLEGPVGTALAWRLEGFRQKSGDYTLAAPLRDEDGKVVAEGRQPNSRTNTRSAAFGGAWFGAPGTRIGMAAQRYESDYGVPNPDEPVTIELRRSRFELQADSSGDMGIFSAVRSRFGFTDYRHTEFEPDGTPGARFTNQGGEARVELAHAQIAGFSGVIGVQAQTAATRGQGEGELPKTRARDAALFAVEERRWGPLRAEFGARIEHVAYRVQEDYESGETAPSRSFSLFSVSAGLGRELAPGWLAGVAVAAAQRAPAVEELYFVGAHPATFAFEIGDPGLRKERSINLDVSLKYTVGPVRVKAGVFVNRVKDYIYGFFDGSTTALPAEGAGGEEAFSNLYFTQADAQLRGGEVEVGYGGRTGVQLRAWGDAVRARLSSGVNDGAFLPRMPPSRLGLDIGWRSDRLHVLAAVTRVFKQDRTSPFDLRDGVAESATAAYTLLDAAVTWKIGHALSLYLQGRNLGDRDVRIHTSFLKSIAPPPGRSLWFGVRAAL